MLEHNIVIVIPAYEPDEKLIALLQEIREEIKSQIIIVDDGSGKAYEEIFKEAETYGLLLSHAENYGKGEAIKTALHYIESSATKDTKVVIADADGQHKVDDILKIVSQVDLEEDEIVIGSREFTGKVPLRSKVGNTITRCVFHMVSKVKVNDTQTGLRAFGVAMIPFLLNVEGSRYEYEMNVLLKCAASNIRIKEVPIQTVYIGKNETSHFRVFRDSFRIYKNILRFSISSLIAFLADFLIYTCMLGLTNQIVLSNVVARAISANMNFFVNREYVFESKNHIWKDAVKYFTLAVCILIINSFLLTYFVENIITNRYVAKISVEMIMFLVSFFIQKNLVFVSKARKGNMLHASK